MNDAAFNFKRSTREISEFSEITGITKTTLRDWRKRGLLAGYGTMLPNGAWGYSMDDAMAVHLAGRYVELGFEWKDALWMGHIVRTYVCGAGLYKGTEAGEAYERALYIAFSKRGKGNLEFRTHHDAGVLLDMTKGAPVTFVINVPMTKLDLPKQFFDGLKALGG